MPEAREISCAIEDRERPWRVNWSIQRCQSISVSSPAKRSPNSGRTLFSHRRRMLAIVVSEYGLPRPLRRPIRPRSTPSSHSSPSEPRVGPRAASSARWSAPLRLEPSQTRTSPRSFLALLQAGLPVTGSRPRPRHDGLQRQRASGSVSAGHRASARRRSQGFGCSASSPSMPLADIAENWPPWGTQGDTNVRNRGLRWGSLGSDPRTDSARNACTAAENGQRSGCRRRDSNPRHADYDSAALTD